MKMTEGIRIDFDIQRGEPGENGLYYGVTEVLPEH